MQQVNSTSSFFAQTGKLTLSDSLQGKLMRPQLAYGISEDLPDNFKNRYSIVRSGQSQSPENRKIKPNFNFNEFAFYGDKEVFDFSSAKPTLTIDMRNSYRLDTQLRSPYFKEYRRALNSNAFAKKKGMFSMVGDSNRSPRIPKRTKPSSLNVSPLRATLKSKSTRPRQCLVLSYEEKEAYRQIEEQRREQDQEVAETQAHILDFEETLRRTVGGSLKFLK